jgi:hypothetical protein
LNLLSTILFAGCLLPKVKDTTRPVFNMYSMNIDSKTLTNTGTNKKATPYKLDPMKKEKRIQVQVKMGSPLTPNP